MRRRTLGSKKLVDKEIRFTSSTSWTIPAGCKSIDIFLVGGGGAGGNWVTWGYTPGGPGSGGGTNTVKNISVISGPVSFYFHWSRRVFCKFRWISLYLNS